MPRRGIYELEAGGEGVIYLRPKLKQAGIGISDNDTFTAKIRQEKKMKKTVPSKIPKFKNDAEIAAFMEKYSAFDLVDAGLADIIPTPLFVRAQDTGKTLLKDKRIQVAFKDERSLRKTFSSLYFISAIFFRHRYRFLGHPFAFTGFISIRKLLRSVSKH